MFDFTLGGRLLNWILLLSAALSILPSMAAITPEGWGLGPLNTVKLLSPAFIVVIVHAALLKRSFHSTEVRVLFFLGLGMIASFIANFGCAGIPNNVVREWVAVSIGTLVALFLYQSSDTRRSMVVHFWMILIAVLCLLDILWKPGSLKLSETLFSAESVLRDIREAGDEVLGSVFSRQSLAKILVLLPWLFLALRKGAPSLRHWCIAGIFWSLTFSTSQRAAVLAIFIALFAFLCHLVFHRGLKYKFILAGISATAALVLLSVILTPKPILLSRGPQFMKKLYSEDLKRVEGLEKTASDNVEFRKRTFLVTLDVIRASPLGNPCVSQASFDARAVIPAHSHNLFLEQFRARGWIFGFLFFAVYSFGVFLCFRNSAIQGGVRFAALAALFVLGMFDQPLFVINHAVLIGWILLESFRGGRLSKAASVH